MRNQNYSKVYFSSILLTIVSFTPNLFCANLLDVTASTQPANISNADTENPILWQWTVPGELNGWTADRVTACIVSDGAVTITTADDFRLISPLLAINADTYRYIAITLKSDINDDSEIFFMPAGQISFSPKVTFQIIGDNKFHTYLIDMAENTKWRGQICRLRFDVVSLPEVNIQIKEIKLLQKPESDGTYTSVKIAPLFGGLAGLSSEIRVNNESQFFDALNLDLPGMEALKAAVIAKDWPVAKKALLEYMRKRTHPRYIIDRYAKDQYVKKVKQEFPGNELDEIITIADRACNNEIVFYGCSCKFDGPVTWDKTKNGFSFTQNCFLNRMIFLPGIGQAYWLTGNNKYAKAACELIDNWIRSCPMPSEIRRHWVWEANPPSVMCLSTNPWGETLGVAQRLSNWTVFNEYFVDSPEVTPEFYYRFMVSLLEQARYIYTIEKMGFFNSNWAIIECSGLVQVAIMFPEFKASSEWLAKVKQLTKIQMKKTVLPDGVQVEISPNYHTWCYEQFIKLQLLSNLNNIELPKGFDQMIKAMYEYLHYKIAYPNRQGYPAIGDGTSVPWWSKKKDKPENSKSMGSNNLESLWNVGINEYDKLKNHEVAVPKYTSTEMTSAGLYVMRSGWDDKDRFLLFDCVAPSAAGGHWHNSALDVDIYAFGRPLIVDPGMFGYGGYTFIDYFQRVRAHNIIEFYSAENRQDPKLIRWLRSKDFCLAEGFVEGPKTANMTRRILFIGGNYWIIDDLTNNALRHAMINRAYWHLNSKSVVVDGKQVQLAFEGNGSKKQCWMGEDGQDLSFYTNDIDTGNILVVPDGSLRYADLTISSDTPCHGYVACYTQIPAPPAKTTLRYTTLLYPFEGTKRPDVSFKDGVVKIGEHREGLYMRKGEQTDGDCAFVGKEDGVINRILLVAGSRISDVIQLDVPADFMIVARHGESLDIQLMESSSKKVNLIELTGLKDVTKVTVNGKLCKVSEVDGKLVIAGPFEKISPNPDNPDLFWIVK